MNGSLPLFTVAPRAAIAGSIPSKLQYGIVDVSYTGDKEKYTCFHAAASGLRDECPVTVSDGRDSDGKEDGSGP